MYIICIMLSYTFSLHKSIVQILYTALCITLDIILSTIGQSQ